MGTRERFWRNFVKRENFCKDFWKLTPQYLTFFFQKANLEGKNLEMILSFKIATDEKEYISMSALFALKVSLLSLGNYIYIYITWAAFS